MTDGLIAALDVGKTHTRLTLIEPRTGKEVWSTRRLNQSAKTALGMQLDLAGIERWLIDEFHSAPHRERIEIIVPIAHGAAAVLIDQHGRTLAAPDYEDPCFEQVSAAYEPERDPFEHTYSPSLPLGLNLGRQLFYLQQREPEVFSRARHILLYPQYWAWRLSGVMASEVTSLGCHSDLWRPSTRSFSMLAQRHGWAERFPAMRTAREMLGPAKGALSVAAGIPVRARVACGIHDSNASYLRHLLSRGKTPFAVISSGTWTIVMASQASLERLCAARDMLANVDALGCPVPTARFMGGREYEAIAGTSERPTLDALRNVLARRAIAVPAFAAGGPFAGTRGRVQNADALSGPERAALATLYVALMSDLLLESLDAQGEIIVDGPLASNPLFPALFASLRPSGRVLVDAGSCATSAISCLAGLEGRDDLPLAAVLPIELDELARYRNHWRSQLPGAGTQA